MKKMVLAGSCSNPDDVRNDLASQAQSEIGEVTIGGADGGSIYGCSFVCRSNMDLLNPFHYWEPSECLGETRCTPSEPLPRCTDDNLGATAAGSCR